MAMLKKEKALGGKSVIIGQGLDDNRTGKRKAYKRYYASVKRVALTKEEVELLEQKGISPSALVRQILRAKKITIEY